MSNRSLSASPQGQKLLRKALERQNLTQMALVNERGIASWSTINRFFNGKPVKRELFIEICDELDLNWQDVATFPQAESPQLTVLDKLWLQLIEIGSSTDNMGLVLAKEETLAWGIKLPSRYEKSVPIGSHIQFEINLEIQGYLLLLLKDTKGEINCFCPSCFAPNSQITAGKTTLPQEAEEKYIAALSLRKRLLGSEHPQVARSLNNLATILTARKRPEESLSYRIQVGLINDKLINQSFAFSSENDRLAILAKLRNNLDLFLSLVYQYLSHSKPAIQQALDFVLKRKALSASVLAAQNEALYSNRYPHLQEQFCQLSDLNVRLVNLTLTIPTNENFENYQKERSQLQTQYNQLQKQLASQVPEMQLFEQVVDRIQVASKLPQDSILIEFVRFDEFDCCAVEATAEQWKSPRYLAFILPARQPNAVQMIDLGEAEIIDRLISEFRKEASDNCFETLAWSKKAAKLPKLQIKSYNSIPAIKLSKLLFEPIHNIVKTCNNIIIAPDGNLNLVPFQILPIDETGTHLVIDEYNVFYLSVGRDILRSQIKTTGICDVPLILADPDFNLTGNSTLPRPLNEEIINTLDDNSLSPIPETRIFAQSIAQKLKNAKLYLGAEATSTHLTNNKCPKIIAIATHGLFVPDSSKQSPGIKRQELSNNFVDNLKTKNPMMRSILALAGAKTRISGGNLPPSAGFGLVSAQDIASLDLWNNELTVLSACDTALGDIKVGEGVFGLRRAFAVAGTKNLVMSLWKVPAKATPLLMEHFFDNLQSNMEPIQALQQAQQYIRNITVKELRQSVLGIAILKELSGVKEFSEQTKIDCHEDDKPLEHPFYWGAWICQGIATIQL